MWECVKASNKEAQKFINKLIEILNKDKKK